VTTATDEGGGETNDEVAFTFEIDQRSIALEISEELYPLDAIYGAAYLFIDRCWLYLGRPGDRLVRVELRTKEEAPDGEVLEALAGEFANELLNQVLRFRIGASTATIREYYMARAFFGGSNHASIDALLAELDQEELEEGELEIAVPWAEEPASTDTDEADSAGKSEPEKSEPEKSEAGEDDLDVSVPWEQKP